MSYPTKAIREACWRERDNLWKCLDDNNDNESKCTEIRKAMIAACPDQWVCVVASLISFTSLYTDL